MIIALGDIHGRGTWKKIVSTHSFRKVVFIGDYLDTKEEINGQTQLENFKEILAYKKANIDKVVLLFGNHDFHYLSTSKYQYNGYQPLFKLAFQEELHKAIDDGLMQMCYISGNVIFTHVGVTKTWCANNGIDKKHLEQSINDLFRFKPNSFEFCPGKKFDECGDEITQTPIWVRPNSLIKDKLDGYFQVVGHTYQEKITTCNGVVFIDTLGSSGEYLQFNKGEFSIVKINN